MPPGGLDTRWARHAFDGTRRRQVRRPRGANWRNSGSDSSTTFTVRKRTEDQNRRRPRWDVASTGHVRVPGTGTWLRRGLARNGRRHSGTRLRRVKKRLDVLLVERGLAESRAQAQALVMAGRVRGYAKPGTQVDDDRRAGGRAAAARTSSRGGEKLAHALDATGVDPSGARRARRRRLDRRVHRRAAPARRGARGRARRRLRPAPPAPPRRPARDRARADERARARARAPVRARPRRLRRLVHLAPDSRCRLRSTLAAPGWRGARPRQAAVRGRPRRGAAEASSATGGPPPRARARSPRRRALGRRDAGVVDSGLPGPKGNREFFLHLVHARAAELADDLDAWIDDAVG